MAETKKDQLGNILKELHRVGNVLASAVVSKDGLIISSELLEDIDSETFAAMAAAMTGAAETAASELKQGEVSQIIVDAERGKLITISAGEKAILVVLAKREINLGLVLLEMKKASEKISRIIGK